MCNLQLSVVYLTVYILIVIQQIVLTQCLLVTNNNINQSDTNTITTINYHELTTNATPTTISNAIFNSSQEIRRLDNTNNYNCDERASTNNLYKRYFDAIDNIYRRDNIIDTCLPLIKKCGWPKTRTNNLPLFVISIGLEGAGHHLWTEILARPVFDCVWTNARHYFRNIGDGVPRTTVKDLQKGFEEQLEIRRVGKMSYCNSIYDAEDSFPTGALRQSGRMFNRPDLINLQQLDGVMFNIKYLVILRNTTVSSQAI